MMTKLSEPLVRGASASAQSDRLSFSETESERSISAFGCWFPSIRDTSPKSTGSLRFLKKIGRAMAQRAHATACGTDGMSAHLNR